MVKTKNWRKWHNCKGKCKKRKRGNNFYERNDVCISCRRLYVKTVPSYNGDHNNTTCGIATYMKKFLQAVHILNTYRETRKGFTSLFVHKWFNKGPYRPNVYWFIDTIEDQCKEHGVLVGDYKKTWKLGFKSTEYETLREQFYWRNLLVVKIDTIKIK